jgi:hypothetical protein
MELLTCTKCKEEKPASSEYFPLHNKKRNGLDSWCRTCRSTYRSEIRRGAYRESISDAALKDIISSTLECVICGENEKLVVDHDHATGEVRGMLCSSCNLGLGKFKDDPELLEYARIYLLSSQDRPEAISYLKAWGC